MKSRFLDKLIERLDRLDPDSLQTHILHLAQEKGLLETIFQAIHEGVIVLDGKGRISYANLAAEKFLGFKAETAVGNPIGKYFKEIEWESVIKLDVEEWSRLVSREIEVTYPEHRFLSFYMVPLATVSDTAEGAVLILRDISHEREHEASTLESERINAITLLAAGVAHEIGNPLNSLNIHLQLLEREVANLGEDDQENIGDLVDVAKNEVARLDQIINQFLRAIRPVDPKFDRASVWAILSDSLDFLKQEIQDRDVLVEVDRPDRLPPVQIDKGQIRQAFFNIIKNAIQAMPSGGLLKIALSSTDRYVRVSFTDSGSGISPEELGNIFEPYHTTKESGSGLGLMIVQRIMRDHGGEIEIHSDPGAGTTFTLYIPREERRVRMLKAGKKA